MCVANKSEVARRLAAGENLLDPITTWRSCHVSTREGSSIRHNAAEDEKNIYMPGN